MATFFMFGRYSAEALKDMSAARTKKAEKVIKRLDGKIVDMYALLGEWDLVLIVELPGVEEVVQASIAMNRMTGISFTSAPAISVGKLDKLVEKL